MFLQGAAPRREELPCLIQGLGADKRPPERRERHPPLFRDYALSSHFFFLGFLPSSICMQDVCARPRVCPFTRVRFVLSAVQAAVGDSCDGNSRGTGCEQKHVLPRAHYVPIRHPLSTPRSLGETSRYFWNFCGLPGAQKLKKGTKGNSILIRLVFNLLNGQSLLIVYLPFVLSNIYSLRVVYKEVMVLHIH